MAKEKDPEYFAQGFATGLVLGFFGYLSDLISSWLMFWLVFLSCTAIGAVLEFMAWDEKKKEKRRESEWESQQEENNLALVRRLVSVHMDTLSRKRKTLIRRGDYGEIVDDAWRNEIKRFVRIQLHPQMYARLGGEERTAGFRLETLVDRMVSAHVDTMGPSSTDVDVSEMDGLEYEVFCGEILEKHGWRVHRTPATGDHGIDLIAEKPGRRVAIQCKKYSTPVGNKAVQEAYSGMSFFDADQAVVVTNSTFTQAANVAANKLAVALKHHDELREL